jgi:nucleoside-diphosphate kinase
MSKGLEQFREKTFVLIKPDGVQRGLIGEIITRFEKKGLKITALQMFWADEEKAAKHYDQPESAMIALGERTIAAYAEKGITVDRTPIEIAKDIQKKLVTYLTTGPIVAMVIEGAHAVQHVRKLRGQTNPLGADVGTITADYTVDSYFISDADERAIRNLVHASGTVEEAEYEINLWFSKDEIFKYELAIEKILYSKDWEDTMRKLVKGE